MEKTIEELEKLPANELKKLHDEAWATVKKIDAIVDLRKARAEEKEEE